MNIGGANTYGQTPTLQRVTVLAALALTGLCTAMEPALAQESAKPAAEFHMGRLVFDSGDRTSWRPWWAIDYPEAEFHLLRGLARLTAVDVAEDSQHLRLTDDEIFDYPWLFAQQPGHWRLTGAEIERLREYLHRGGFLVVDDFHGDYDWQVMKYVLSRALPEWPIERIPAD
ncbi:MAG: DUF4159 domain-containing protein, partial [Gammaproteobacteria bacterium]|nr:DUF4159 domain-containing protein [Gammaproteobacteria bacterium]